MTNGASIMEENIRRLNVIVMLVCTEISTQLIIYVM